MIIYKISVQQFLEFFSKNRLVLELFGELHWLVHGYLEEKINGCLKQVFQA
jgi:hypothetical protein